jgi:hypothetical protein
MCFFCLQRWRRRQRSPQDERSHPRQSVLLYSTGSFNYEHPLLTLTRPESFKFPLTRVMSASKEAPTRNLLHLRTRHAKTVISVLCVFFYFFHIEYGIINGVIRVRGSTMQGTATRSHVDQSRKETFLSCYYTTDLKPCLCLRQFVCSERQMKKKL